MSPGVLGLATHMQCVLCLIVYTSSLHNRSGSSIAHSQFSPHSPQKAVVEVVGVKSSSELSEER